VIAEETDPFMSNVRESPPLNGSGEYEESSASRVHTSAEEEH